MTISETSPPPRKPVTAWEVEHYEENGDEFAVLTFHHGLGKMTRLDLSYSDVAEIASMLGNFNVTDRLLTGDMTCAHCDAPIYLVEGEYVHVDTSTRRCEQMSRDTISIAEPRQ